MLRLCFQLHTNPFMSCSAVSSGPRPRLLLPSCEKISREHKGERGLQYNDCFADACCPNLHVHLGSSPPGSSTTFNLCPTTRSWPGSRQASARTRRLRRPRSWKYPTSSISLRSSGCCDPSPGFHHFEIISRALFEVCFTYKLH